MVSRLPQGLSLDQMQSTWSTILSQTLTCPLIRGNLLSDVALVSGSNIINHKLNRKLTGWILVRIGAAAVIYDTQDTNQMPDKTLSLVSDADATVSIWVF